MARLKRLSEFISSIPAPLLLTLTFFFSSTTLQTTPNVFYDFGTSGSYRIQSCNLGAGISQDRQFTVLKHLLPTVWYSIQQLLQDIPRGTTSLHGYAALFKTDTNLESIRQVYQDIVDGPDILTYPPPDFQPRRTPPTIICANPGDPATIIYQEACNSPSVSYLPIQAGVAKHSAILYVCPSFFRLPSLPGPAACPRVNTTMNKFEPGDDGLQLSSSQFFVLVHEIAHLYLQAGGLGNWGEADGLDEAVALNATASRWSAINYAFYAAGESVNRA